MEDDNSTELQHLRQVIERQRKALSKAKEMLKDLPGSYWDGESAVKEIELIEGGKQ